MSGGPSRQLQEMDRMFDRIFGGRMEPFSPAGGLSPNPLNPPSK
jgi:hypothetical protein